MGLEALDYEEQNQKIIKYLEESVCFGANDEHEILFSELDTVRILADWAEGEERGPLRIGGRGTWLYVRVV